MAKHCKGVSEGDDHKCPQVSDWMKSESMQGSWVMSASKWFADEKEDTGLHTAENSKFFGIASLIKSFSNEGKELSIQS